MSIEIVIPHRSIVVLIGLPGCGKSTFARRHFPDTAVLNSDACRKLVADDERNQVASPQAFTVMETIAAARMQLGRLVVIDATNLKVSARRPWLDLARLHKYPAWAIVLDVPAAVCIERDAARSRRVGVEPIVNNIRRMSVDSAELLREGFDEAWWLGQDAIEQVQVRLVRGERRG